MSAADRFEADKLAQLDGAACVLRCNWLIDRVKVNAATDLPAAAQYDSTDDADARSFRVLQLREHLTGDNRENFAHGCGWPDADALVGWLTGSTRVSLDAAEATE